jgi:hypothetical protein
VEVVVERQNVTLSIPKEILKKAKILAIEQDTSLSGLLTRVLTETVEQYEQYARAKMAHLQLLEEGVDLGTGGKIAWERESLQDR